MNSIIDWNELVPRLPKQIRDTLYLEAVALLSEQDEGEPVRRRKKKKSTATKMRDWATDGDGQRLSAPGRKYRINKGSPVGLHPNSEIGKLWKYVLESKGDSITYEGLASIAQGYPDLRGAADVVYYLWARRLIDIIP